MDIERQSGTNLLNRVEVISSAAAKCSLNFSNLTEIDGEVAEISEFLGITHDQTVLFSCLAELSIQRTVALDSLAKHLKCSVLKILNLMNEIEVLEKKGYVQRIMRKRSRRQSFNDLGFSVPHFVIEAIRKGDASLFKTGVKFDLPGFLKQVTDIIDEREDGLMTTAQVLAETEYLIANNRDLPYVEYIDEAVSSTISKCTLFGLSYIRLKGQFYLGINNLANTLFDDLGEQLDFSQTLFSGNHELTRKNLVRLGTSDFDGDKVLSLTENTMKVLYRSYPDLLMPETERTGIITHKGIKSRKLFFNGPVREQIESISEVLQPSRFRAYGRELRRNNLSSGITAIFHGAPGTGKTESVYQIARNTGRNIMMVDLSQTRSKWFGESEKVVKKIFDDYSSLLRNSDREPILFINEADGFFSKRLELGNRGTSTDQTMNTIQNILLQALENFEGILIATTNLTDNLDGAFERRFSFRIEFPKPDAQSRKSIWKSKLPDLSDEEAGKLAEMFEMSGGDIDVQVRQALLQKVLRKNVKLYDIVEENCRKDHGFGGRKRIGY
ncbi:MAG TPA: ATP-binding protein [Bacteroidales bacterium]|nr:ATP-binding protein [Bacteroidales bacterium]HPJ58808.1 ATP-binding protein [Bacteroidales bacterium]HPR11958.1 ATP-binding protein [Bacteroidales bacterium]HRW85750.1 ATP-binding protein [Bacteroidales bacterium]